MDKYGADVWTTAILCILFSLIISYFYYTNVLEVVRADWPNQKCNPLYIPFAGFINNTGNKSSLEFTAENFNGCINGFLKYVVEIAVMPIQVAMNVLNVACQGLIDSVNLLRGLVKNLRDQYGSIFQQLFGGAQNLVIYFLNFVVKMKDSLGKIQGILATVLYMIFGAYKTCESLFLSIVNFIAKILYYMARICFIFIDLSEDLNDVIFIGYLLSIPPMIFMGIWILLPIFIPVYVVLLLIEMGLNRAMGLSTPILPGIPSCFAGDTIVELSTDGETKKIKDIVIGDTLRNGSKVTAVLKLSAAEQHMYHLNDVMVSGEHRVFHPILHWIKVKDHPQSIYVANFNEPFLYCLNTDKKCFTIATTIYSDWDDIDEKVEADLRENCDYLPEKFTFADIHTQLDGGFHSNTLIILKNGTTVPINEIMVNDVLASGDKVRGIVKIAAHDLVIYKHSFGLGYSLCASRNIHTDDVHLGAKNAHREETNIPFLYHLLTDTSFFMANNIRVRDYNSGIDAYLN
jgi:hypothetical protein